MVAISANVEEMDGCTIAISVDLTLTLDARSKNNVYICFSGEARYEKVPIFIKYGIFKTNSTITMYFFERGRGNVG
jgi:hypothetical protein